MTTITESDLTGLKADITTIDEVVESTASSTTTKSGTGIATLNGRLSQLGFRPPITYAGSIVFGTTDQAKTIERNGLVYGPRTSELPFTTTGTWTANDENKFYVIFRNDPLIRVFNLAYLDGLFGAGLLGTQISSAFGILLAAGDIVRVQHYNSGRVAGSGADWQYTGVTTIGKAGTLDAGYAYDQAGEQFTIVGQATVTKFGAVGDDTADDTAAIQAADDAAAGRDDKILYWPAGRYKVTSTINKSELTYWYSPGVARFSGKAKGADIRNTHDGTVISCVGTNTAYAGGIEGLYFSNAVPSNANAIAVVLDSVKWHPVRNCFSQFYNQALTATDSSTLHLINNFFTGGGSGGSDSTPMVFIDNCDDSVFMQNEIAKGLSAVDSNACRMVAERYQVGDNVFKLQDCDRWSITASVFDIAETCVNLIDCKEVKFTNCDFFNIVNYAFRIETTATSATERNSVIGCSFRETVSNTATAYLFVGPATAKDMVLTDNQYDMTTIQEDAELYCGAGTMYRDPVAAFIADEDYVATPFSGFHYRQDFNITADRNFAISNVCWKSGDVFTLVRNDSSSFARPIVFNSATIATLYAGEWLQVQVRTSTEAQVIARGSNNEDFQPVREVLLGNLQDISHSVNTDRKYRSKQVWNITNSKPAFASGATAGSAWLNADGTTQATPS